MKICIGIISYIPDNLRQQRQFGIQRLFNKLDEIFPNQPIIIIKQNGKDYNPVTNHEIISYDYDRLGILKARKILRQKFLESDFDYMIMLDDDSKIEGSDGSQYIKEIEDHPNCFGGFSNHLLKLFAISKNIYSQIDMPDIDAEKLQGFEDKIFICMCRIRFPEYEFEFSHDKLKETSYGDFQGPPSTGWGSEPAKHRQEMRDNTTKFIEEYKELYNSNFIIPKD